MSRSTDWPGRPRRPRTTMADLRQRRIGKPTLEDQFGLRWIDVVIKHRAVVQQRGRQGDDQALELAVEFEPALAGAGRGQPDWCRGAPGPAASCRSACRRSGGPARQDIDQLVGRLRGALMHAAHRSAGVRPAAPSSLPPRSGYCWRRGFSSPSRSVMSWCSPRLSAAVGLVLSWGSPAGSLGAS